MECSSPLSASFDSDGRITFSAKNASCEYVPFRVPCGKCLACRLNRAREKAVRAFHESQMHDSSMFLTLTYNDEHIGDSRLHYRHFQLYMKKLRKRTANKLTYMVTGEYGEQTKRPHWHAIIFGYEYPDKKRVRSTELEHSVYESRLLESDWPLGFCEFGGVTIDSASYVARYAAKKLVHGHDQDHDFHPIHRTSGRNALGKRWIEKYHEQTFTHGYVRLPNGEKTGIPRYYKDWYKKHHPNKWLRYVTEVQPLVQELAVKNEERDLAIWLRNLEDKRGLGPDPLRQSKVKEYILSKKFERLQKELKL